MTPLQTRLAQADKPTRELLEEAWGSCPVCSGDCGSANPPVMFCPTSRFLQLLDAEAWTSAVEMLVPEGHRWSIDTCDGQPRSFVAPPAPYEGQPWWGNAAAPALALAIACLKARGL